MKFEKTVKACMENCPCLFQQRWQVLDYLFCMYGTGYKWVNGELVRKKHKKEENNLNELSIKRMIERAKQAEIDFSVPSKEISPLLNYPDNIKSDWLKGLNETKELYADFIKNESIKKEAEKLKIYPQYDNETCDEELERLFNSL